MRRFNSLFKKEPELPKKVWETSIEKIVEVPQSVGDVLVANYPKSKYKVYWETIINENEGEVRFIGYNGENIREVHSIVSDSPQKVQQLANKLIAEKMDNFKR